MEGVAVRIKEWFPEEEILFSILSNLATESLAIATLYDSFERLAKDKETGQLIAEKIRQASEYAKLDPYRATTTTKRIMNATEAVILATGNDTRAAAAAIHAYAARNGSYQGLTDWQIKEDRW